jgi:hypothetical protein
MKSIAKLLISIVLYCYSFGAIWLVNLSTSEARTLHWYGLIVMIFVSLLSLWAFTWLKKFRKASIIGLLLAFTLLVPYTFIGFPNILYIVGPALPIILLAVLYVWLYWQQTKST